MWNRTKQGEVYFSTYEATPFLRLGFYTGHVEQVWPIDLLCNW